MTQPMGKRLERIEKKKKKIAALLEITKLNDRDREAKILASKQKQETQVDKVNGTSMSAAEISQNLKRLNDEVSNDSCLEVSGETDAKAEEDPNFSSSKKPRLSGDEYIQLKEELRARKKLLKTLPRFRLKDVGEFASLKFNGGKQDRVPIFLNDVQHLLLYSLLGHFSPYLPTRWCQLEKHNKIAHTVLLVIEGLSLYHFMAYENMFSHITNHLDFRLELITPAVYGGSVIQDLTAIPLTGTQSEKLIKKYGSLEAALKSTGDVIKLLRTTFPMTKSTPADDNAEKVNLPSTDKFPRTQLLLSLWQMIEENYPVPLKGELANRYHEYVFTKDSYAEATAISPMFGLDCEMCKTTTGELELTRISVVDEAMNTIYDSLVKPDNEITDYLTKYSGITREMLANVTTTLSDVQQSLRSLLPKDAILVGQSLNFDLHTLKMMHPYVIDTSVIFNITGDRYRKTKLQTLARKFLGERIQESRAGHCSTEDSKASLKLTQLKLANSVGYGDAVLHGPCDTITKEECLSEKRAFEKQKKHQYATSLFTHVTKNTKTAAIVGNTEVMNEYSQYLKNSSLNIMDDKHFDKDDQVRLVIEENNKHAVARTSEIAMEHAFTLCHVRIGEDQLKDENLEKTFRAVDKWFYKIWQHTALHGLTCVVFSGQNNASNGVCFLNIKKEINSVTPA